MENNIKEKINKELQSVNIPDSNLLWNDISKRIDERNSNRRNFFLFGFASLMVLFTAIGFYFYSNDLTTATVPLGENLKNEDQLKNQNLSKHETAVMPFNSEIDNESKGFVDQSEIELENAVKPFIRIYSDSNVQALSKVKIDHQALINIVNDINNKNVIIKNELETHSGEITPNIIEINQTKSESNNIKESMLNYSTRNEALVAQVLQTKSEEVSNVEPSISKIISFDVIQPVHIQNIHSNNTNYLNFDLELTPSPIAKMLPTIYPKYGVLIGLNYNSNTSVMLGDKVNLWRTLAIGAFYNFKIKNDLRLNTKLNIGFLPSNVSYHINDQVNYNFESYHSEYVGKIQLGMNIQKLFFNKLGIEAGIFGSILSNQNKNRYESFIKSNDVLIKVLETYKDGSEKGFDFYNSYNMGITSGVSYLFKRLFIEAKISQSLFDYTKIVNDETKTNSRNLYNYYSLSIGIPLKWE